MGSHHFWLNEIKQKIIATDTHNYTILNSYNSVLGMVSKSILKLILFSKESLPGIYRPLGLDNLVLGLTGSGQWIPVNYGHTLPLWKFWMLRFWYRKANENSSLEDVAKVFAQLDGQSRLMVEPWRKEAELLLESRQVFFTMLHLLQQPLNQYLI